MTARGQSVNCNQPEKEGLEITEAIYHKGVVKILLYMCPVNAYMASCYFASAILFPYTFRSTTDPYRYYPSFNFSYSPLLLYPYSTATPFAVLVIMGNLNTIHGY